MGRHRALAGEYPARVEPTHSQLPLWGLAKVGVGWRARVNRQRLASETLPC